MNHVHSPTGAAWAEWLLSLYPAAVDQPSDRFHRSALLGLRRHVPFDCCWWATDHFVDGHHRITGSLLWNMPADLPQLFNDTEGDNIVARRASAAPDKAFRFGPAELSANPATAVLARHAKLTQVLSVATYWPAMRVLSFLSLGRRSLQQTFSVAEAQLLERLMPHLGAMQRMSRAQDIQRYRAGAGFTGSRIGIADAGGIVHVMEPGFERALQREWSGWRGPLLPLPLRQSLLVRQPRFLGRGLRIELSWREPHVLLEVKERTCLDDLSVRELSVASAYAEGHSHKEVARRLGLAPTTVRHHLRNAYSKLGVRDKAALAKLMAACLRGPSPNDSLLETPGAPFGA